MVAFHVLAQLVHVERIVSVVGSDRDTTDDAVCLDVLRHGLGLLIVDRAAWRRHARVVDERVLVTGAVAHAITTSPTARRNSALSSSGWSISMNAVSVEVSNQAVMSGSSPAPDGSTLTVSIEKFILGTSLKPSVP